IRAQKVARSCVRDSIASRAHAHAASVRVTQRNDRSKLHDLRTAVHELEESVLNMRRPEWGSIPHEGSLSSCIWVQMRRNAPVEGCIPITQVFQFRHPS